MTDNSVVADRDGLASLCGLLRAGAGDLADAALPASGAPDAGRSSENVRAALSAIVRSMALLIAHSQIAARDIDVSSGAYGNTDNQTATGLHDLEGELLGPN